MNFAEARAKWVEFGADLDAAFDYIEALPLLEKMVMLGMAFCITDNSYPILLSERYRKIAYAIRPHFLAETGDRELLDQLKQLEKEDEDSQK